ncbi:hypothetical protein Taro_031355 [Colocasia esculenta]|uniref:BED-type domain-containing protein n=1 Tax=Colocasia esculenta TaxID=4460 RepID=A0A843W656_COLES|nr:hypothetical protein [Colocasia esculenta]
MVKKEQTSGSSSKPTNGKKRSFNNTDGPSQEWKPKVFTPFAPNKPKCKHCDEFGHTVEECWRKLEVSIMEANTTLNVTESDASLNATDVETSSSLSRPRKRFSKVWLHFTEKYLEDGNKRALCNYCNASFASSNNIGTSHLSRHISQ